MKTSMLAAGAALTFALAMTTAEGSQPQPASESGPHVERAQKALKSAGHDPGAIDGVLGARTSAALRAYQSKHGLSATGRLDEATSAKLAGHATPSSAREQSGGDTRPSAVDPSQATRTGGNVGDGASYSRSTEKGLSTK
jgi:peptidoglycan hydrolase-like protein with peptidoglycan-binding domain